MPVLVRLVVVLAISEAAGVSAQPITKPSDIEAIESRLTEYNRHAKYRNGMDLAGELVGTVRSRYGESSLLFADAVSWLARFVGAENDHVRALSLYGQALPIYEAQLAPADVRIANALNNVGFHSFVLGRLEQSQAAFQRALQLREIAEQPDPGAIANVINNLATLYYTQGRLTEAEPLLRRALQMRQKVWPEGHTEIAASLGNLAQLYQAQNKHRDAEPLLKDALAMRRKLQPAGHPEIAGALSNLGMNYVAQNRVEEAQRLLEQTLDIRLKNQPHDHPEVASAFNNLAHVYFILQKFSEAEQHFRRALEIQERSLPADHPQIIATLQDIAALQHESGRAAAALATIRRATKAMETRGSLDGRHYRRHVTIVWRAVEAGVASADALFPETFLAAQRTQQTGVSSAVSRMAARLAANDPALGDIIRGRETLLDERNSAERALNAALARAVDERRGDDVRARERLREIAASLTETDQKLRDTHPDYFTMASPGPLTAKDVQAQLRDDEALVLFLDTRAWHPVPEATFIWVVTKTSTRWTRSKLGTEALRTHVAALRCGLDTTLWNGRAEQTRCEGLLKTARPVRVTFGQETRSVPPFDLARAHALYAGLLGPLDDVIRDKHLLILPTGPLANLPFNVLVTEAPKIARGKTPSVDDYRRTAWLGVRQPTTVLPSVAALESLRRFAKTSHARRHYLGIGNPLLDGPDGAWSELALRARRIQQCPSKADMELTHARLQRTATAQTSAFRSASVDIEEVRRWTPLPETAMELCMIGRHLDVQDDDILLGNAATETKLKSLSEAGRLADYSVLHFATHGALSGQVLGLAEPGLLLTPPPQGTSDSKALDRDNGFLATSEIALLKLDADWVILSACNTAAGANESAETLSGMARAFFYAGARALLVSHWEVNSMTAVRLTTATFTELAAEPRMGRAEAFRRSMRNLLSSGTPFDAHPSMWAPFVVVGEGAR